MKTLKPLLLTALLSASIISFVSCNSPAQPTPTPSGNDLANKTYQTNWDNSTPPSLERLVFSSDGKSAKYFIDLDYSSEPDIKNKWESIKQLTLSNNPNSTFDDTTYKCFQEQEWSPVSLEDLLKGGFFSSDYSKYTIPATGEDPAKIFYRQ